MLSVPCVAHTDRSCRSGSKNGGSLSCSSSSATVRSPNWLRASSASARASEPMRSAWRTRQDLAWPGPAQGGACMAGRSTAGLRDLQAHLHDSFDVPVGGAIQTASDQVIPASESEGHASGGHALGRGIVLVVGGVLRGSHGLLLTGRATLPPQRAKPSTRSGGNATRTRRTTLHSAGPEVRAAPIHRSLSVSGRAVRGTDGPKLTVGQKAQRFCAAPPQRARGTEGAGNARGSRSTDDNPPWRQRQRLRHRLSTMQVASRAPAATLLEYRPSNHNQLRCSHDRLSAQPLRYPQRWRLARRLIQPAVTSRSTNAPVNGLVCAPQLIYRSKRASSPFSQPSPWQRPRCQGLVALVHENAMSSEEPELDGLGHRGVLAGNPEFSGNSLQMEIHRSSVQA